MLQGSGIFIVVDAVTGAPLGIFQENRYMTDIRTGKLFAGFDFFFFVHSINGSGLTLAQVAQGRLHLNTPLLQRGTLLALLGVEQLPGTWHVQLRLFVLI